MKAIDVYNAVVTWSRAHDVAASIIGGTLLGLALPYIVRLFK